MSTYEILITNNCNRVGLYKIETDRNEFSLKPVKLTYDKKPSRFEVPTIAILKNNQLVGKITLMAVHGTETFISEIAEDFTGDEIYSSLRFATDLMRSRKGEEIGVGVITSIHIKKGKRILERVSSSYTSSPDTSDTKYFLGEPYRPWLSRSPSKLQMVY